MAKLGRKPHADKPRQWKITLPDSIATQVELLLCDAMTGKPAYGARGDLITKLLREWLEKQYKNRQETTP